MKCGTAGIKAATEPFLSRSTAGVDSSLALFNREHGRFTIMSINIKFETNGEASVGTEISSANASADMPLWRMLLGIMLGE
jgi:hypothetical protein